MAENETRAAMQMANTMINGSTRILQALIDALADQTRNPKDRQVLDNFRDYVAKGGSLLTLPVEQSKADQLEQLINESGITAYKTSTAYAPNVYEYIFRRDDEAKMESIILQMRENGVNLVETSQMDYTTLSDAAKGQMYVGVCHNDRDAEVYKLQLDTLCIPYACTKYPDRVEIAVSSADYQSINDLPQLAGLSMRDINKKITMNDVKSIVQGENQKQEQKQERDNANKKRKSRE